MRLIETWNTVPFDLELIVDFNYYACNKENNKKLHEVAGDVRTRIAGAYPTMELHGSTTLSGYYGGEHRGPALHGNTDSKTFKKVFGDNIRRGFSVLVAPICIPCAAYFKWYQTGDLIVPDSLKDIVKGVYVSRSAIGSFIELNLRVPSNAKDY